MLNVADDDNTGYIIECDLHYSIELHDLHNDYPLAPDHLVVTRDMLCEAVENTVDKNWKSSRKLIPNLYDKKKYVCHYRNLQFYVQQGLIVDKIHRILAFKQSRWLEPWISYCTAKRQIATSDFESNLAKLQANSTFGKTMEQVRKRVNVRLICDPHKLTKAVSSPMFQQAEIINNDLTMVRGARRLIKLNKPISVGFTILEISKLIMYKFYYEHLKTNFKEKYQLLFTDTDSLCCHIETNKLYDYIKEKEELFDTSNFDTNHPLHSEANKCVIGKFKSETGSLAPREFVGLRAKMYSLDVPGNKKHSKISAKGIKKSYVKKHVRHTQFLDVLRSHKTSQSTFRLIQTKITC